MKKGAVLFFFLLLLNAFSYGQGQVTLHAGLAQPVLISKSNWNYFVRYPDLSPTLQYGIAFRVDSAKKAALFFETDVVEGKGRDMKWGSMWGYTLSSLKYRVITYGLVEKFRLGTDKLFFLTGLSLSSSFQKLGNIETNGVGGILDYKLVRGRTRCANLGFQTGIEFRQGPISLSVRMRLITYFRQLGANIFNLDNSAVSLVAGYSFAPRSRTQLGKQNSKNKKRRAIGELCGFRIGASVTEVDSSLYNTSFLHIDKYNKRVKGGEISFFVLHPLIKRVSLLVEGGFGYRKYNIAYTDNIHNSGPDPAQCALKHQILTFNTSIQTRLGIGRRESFFVQMGVGTIGKLFYKAIGEYEYGKFDGSAWFNIPYPISVTDIGYFPFDVFTHSALFGFGFQRINIGNRRLFTECRVSAPLGRSYFKGNASMDNVTTSLSLGIFFNKFK